MERPSQRGSALIILLIAVALFGLVTYAFLQGSRNNLSMMTDEASKVAGYQGQDCTNAVNMAIKRLNARGCGTLISAAASGGNNNPGAPTDGSCSIFHVNGGGVKPCSNIATGPADCAGLGDPGNSFYNDPVSGHCYYKSWSAGFSWSGAESACAADGAYLAVLSSSAENDIPVDELGFMNSSWIGMSDAAAEGIWRYTGGELNGSQFWNGDATGSVVGGLYNNWNAGEPNNSYGSENCVLYDSSTKKWDDHTCGDVNSYICEKSGTP